MNRIKESSPVNQTIFQFFHWYYSSEGNLWNHAAAEAGRLAAFGVTQVWLPPAYKSALGINEPGYAVYDLYDLGEFDQKGTVSTRHGTKEQYIACIDAFHKAGVRVLADIVLNHKHGGDEYEEVTIRRVNPDNRLEFINGDEKLPLPTRFTFPGRAGKYSAYAWDHQSFTGVQLEDGIGLIQHQYSNGSWEDMIEDELGNYDFLMGNDIEYRNPAVREELKQWAKWYVETTGADGFRLDALKHISANFYPEWLEFLHKHFNKDFLRIGEYWRNNTAALEQYIDATQSSIPLFDVPLHQNFYKASKEGNKYDLRKIFDNTLTSKRPDMAISFVDNHDTQPLQALESTVDYWFKPLAYAMILLRAQGTPCVFYPAFYEAKYYEQKNGHEIYIELNKVPGLPQMMRCRMLFAYGEQYDFFAQEHLTGWTRAGIPEKTNSGCAVVISNDADGLLQMRIGNDWAGQKMKCIYGNRAEIIQLNEYGEGLFPVNGCSVSVWIKEAADIDN